MKQTFIPMIHVVFLILMTMVGGSCVHRTATNQYQSPSGGPGPVVDHRYSLQADRSELDELRQQVPEEKRRANDEEAFLAQLMSDTKKSPAEIRNTFDRLMRQKREVLDRDIRGEREAFNRREQKDRETFLRAQSKSREKQLKTLPRDARADFFKDQEMKRKVYFSDEREKRNDFESQIREKRKNFEDYARSKTNEFNAELRSYEKRYDEMKKNDAEKP